VRDPWGSLFSGDVAALEGLRSAPAYQRSWQPFVASLNGASWAVVLRLS
jgi:hypothetical protein